MQYRTLGRTGLNASILGFGAAVVAYLDTDHTQAATVVNDLIDAGVNVIDTAASYPGSEDFLGQNIGHRRENLILVSKCGSSIPESNAREWSERLILDSVDRSLRLLRTDRIDVMLLHSCDLQTLQKREALGALVKARNAGKIRFVGYSGDNEAAAWAAAQSDVEVIETSINITDQRNIDMVLPVARRHNAGVIAKRPVANAAWKDPAEQPGMYRSYAKTYTERFRQMNLLADDLGFTGDPHDAWPQIALWFTLSFPEVHTAIIGTSNPDHARRNLGFIESGPLPPDTVKLIRDAFRRADPDGTWLGMG